MEENAAFYTDEEADKVLRLHPTGAKIWLSVV